MLAMVSLGGIRNSQSRGKLIAVEYRPFGIHGSLSITPAMAAGITEYVLDTERPNRPIGKPPWWIWLIWLVPLPSFLLPPWYVIIGVRAFGRTGLLGMERILSPLRPDYQGCASDKGRETSMRIVQAS